MKTQVSYLYNKKKVNEISNKIKNLTEEKLYVKIDLKEKEEVINDAK